MRRRVLLALVLVLAVGLLVAFLVFRQTVVVHLSQETGTSSGSSRAYSFWSGFGSDIGELTIVAGLIGIYRAHTCHTNRCWRWAKYPVEGTPYKVCRRCHPIVPDEGPSLAHIHDAHREAQGDR